MRWDRHTDKYGRSCHTLIGDDHQAIARCCCLPKRTFPERTYLANDWRGNGDASVTYHPTLRAAKAHLETHNRLTAGA